MKNITSMKKARHFHAVLKTAIQPRSAPDQPMVSPRSTYGQPLVFLKYLAKVGAYLQHSLLEDVF